jgi:hypothetical protein
MRGLFGAHLEECMVGTCLEWSVVHFGARNLVIKLMKRRGCRCSVSCVFTSF